MARDSQPPPPQLIADLQDRLDALQSEFDDYRQSCASLRGENARLGGECAELERIVRERDEEIVYLQGQLESAVGELAEAKFAGCACKGYCVGTDGPASANTPLRMMADMKHRLHTLEDRLSHCNITQQKRTL